MTEVLCERCYSPVGNCRCPDTVYRREMGREPPVVIVEDDPLAWHWTYTGAKEERERLRLELLQEEAELEAVDQLELL